MVTACPSPYALESLNPDGFLVLRSAEGGGEGPEDFLCEYANPAAEALLGPQLAGQRVLARHPRLARLVASWRDTLRGGCPGLRNFTVGEGSEARAVRARATRLEDGVALAVWLTDITEEARFVNAVESFEQRLLGYAESMPDALLEVDDGWRVLFANRQAERLLGRRREALVGRVLWEVYEAAPGSEFERQLQRTLASGQPAEFEDRGGQVGRCLGVQAVRTEEGLLLYLRDMTSQRRGEEALRRASALFGAVLHGSTDAIYTKDLAGRYTRINLAGARLLGRSPEEVVGHSDAELWPEDQARTTAAHDREVLAFRRTFTYEEVEPGPNPRIWLSTKGVLKDEGGAVFGLFGISRDITERKRMEEALRNNEARVQQALSAAALTLWDLRLPEGVLRWERNAAASFALASLPPEEPLAAFLARIHPEDRLQVAERLAHTHTNHGPDELALAYRLLLPDGSVRHHLLRARAQRERDGYPGRMLGVLADVTQGPLGSALFQAA